MVEQRSPKPQVVGSSPSWPVRFIMSDSNLNLKDRAIWSFVIIVWLTVLWLMNSYIVSNKLIPVLIAMALIVFSVFVLGKTTGFNVFFEKIMQVKSESSKVTWANWDATRKTAVMVSALVAAFALLMWVVDTVFTLAVKTML